MPPILVRLNLPGFSSPEPFRLADAPPSMTGLACAVLEEIGGFSKEELDGVRNNLDTVPLTFLGELCAGQLVELASDAELRVFLDTSESPGGPAILEVRPQGADVGSLEEISSPSPTKAVASSTAIGGLDVATVKPVAVNGAFAVAADALPAPTVRSPAGNRAVGGAGYPDRFTGRDVASAPPPPASTLPKPAPPPAHAPAPAPAPAHAPVAAAPMFNGTQGPAGKFHSNGHSFELAAALQPVGQTPQPAPQARHPGDYQAPPVRPRTPDSQYSRKSRGGSRASTPPCERRVVGEGDGAPRSRGGVGNPEHQGGVSQVAERQPSRDAPVHMRLYQDKDDRRRRLEEARLRQIEQEEDDIRSAAKRALGRAPSPGRAASPSGRASSPAATNRAGARTPPRTRPPLPQGGQSLPQRHGQRSRDRTAGIEHVNRRSTPAHASSHGHAAHEVESTGSAALSPSVASPGAALAAQDASSIASEGACGLQSCGSVGTLIGEDSLCGDVGSAVVVSCADDAQSLRHMVTTQQQRIQVLESMHQQALKHLRKSREELAKAHQQRFHEADRVLRLEQLFSEMQAQRFDGDMQAQLRWEQWLARSRAIFEDEQT